MTNAQRYVASTALPVSAVEAFKYHDRPGALDRLIPPWEKVVIESSDQSLEVGSNVVLKNYLMGIPLRWHAQHTHYDPPRFFADTQLSGPFAVWNHQHHFEGSSEEHSVIRDQIEYRLPAGALGRFFGGGLAKQKIESMFAYRHQVTRDDLELMEQHSRTPLSVAISGSSGLVGKQLHALLTLFGHQTRRIVRGKSAEGSDGDTDIAAWSGDGSEQQFEQVDAVVHLAGKSIAEGRWTDAVKEEIRDSRVLKTRQLCESLARLQRKPKVLICASATGIYGNRGDEPLTETSAPGDDFLASVAHQWEAACQPATDAGIRVVNARLGIVLSPRGGALNKMLLPAKLLGGALGNGRQWWSWISLDDVLGAFYHCIHDTSISGPVNLVSPTPVTNRDFARTLGRVIGRPALFPAPAFALRAAMGEMADALLLASTRVTPAKLQQSSYRYRFTQLDAALRYYLGRNRLESAE